MLTNHQRLAIYLEDALGASNSKMGHGVLRYIENPVVCVIDSTHAGKTVRQACGLPYDAPVVGTIAEAVDLAAEALVLGIAPSGGKIPEAWIPALNEAVDRGLSIVNGLHDLLNPRFQGRLKPGQWIWDIRQPRFVPPIGNAKAAALDNTRVLFVGTDMAIGKMTAGLELYRWLREHGHATEFIATGQIGITILGHGIPLDAFKVDHACGAVESMVMAAKDADYILVEGQGSLLHPGSTATLPLLRGACPNRLVMCHKTGVSRTRANTIIPALREFIQLNEDLASCCGSLTSAKTIGVALNTAGLSDQGAVDAIAELEGQLEIPVTDVVRFGPQKLGNALLDSRRI